jgi:hypothetical protein
MKAFNFPPCRVFEPTVCVLEVDAMTTVQWRRDMGPTAGEKSRIKLSSILRFNPNPTIKGYYASNVKTHSTTNIVFFDRWIGFPLFCLVF